MGNSTVAEITRLHEKLATIYRRGLLTPAEIIETKGLWARIERLSAAQVAAEVQEDRARQAMLVARQTEGME
jgi:hypothetical protein